MTRVESRFAELKAAKKKGFVAYITAGDPSLDVTYDAVLRLEDVGVDIVELGIPFSDPLADGRVNQESAARALEGGATMDKVLAMVAMLRRKTQIPLVGYTYMNPMYALGFADVTRRAAAAGFDGLLVLDLPIEEAGTYAKLFKKYNVNNIRLVTPTTPDDRIKKIVASGTGFTYCVSREGVTGMQKKLSKGATDLVRRTKSFSPLPVAIGFGISSPETARVAARAADAIVVGSAIVDRFHREGKRAAKWVGTLVKAVKHV
jgi:tryptophan synthase alpha chain